MQCACDISWDSSRHVSHASPSMVPRWSGRREMTALLCLRQVLRRKEKARGSVINGGPVMLHFRPFASFLATDRSITSAYRVAVPFDRGLGQGTSSTRYYRSIYYILGNNKYLLCSERCEQRPCQVQGCNISQTLRRMWCGGRVGCPGFHRSLFLLRVSTKPHFYVKTTR